ncbi:MAG TPA: hypothetical protein P5155_00585 [Candidatus Absconditabacterales bacterium]|nr:hypothetical protein [Candidatus Absconditabacterales bacterium]
MNNQNVIDAVKQKLVDKGIPNGFALFINEKQFPRRQTEITKIIGGSLIKQLIPYNSRHSLTRKQTQQLASILGFDLQKDMRLFLQQHGLNDSVDILRSSKTRESGGKSIAKGTINQHHINLLLNNSRSGQKLDMPRILDFIDGLGFNLYEDIKNKVKQENSTYTSVLMSIFPGDNDVLETFKKRYGESSEYSFLRKQIILELIKDIKFRGITIDIFTIRSRDVLQSTAEGDLGLSNMNIYKRLRWILGYSVPRLSQKVRKEFAEIWKYHSYPYM